MQAQHREPTVNTEIIMSTAINNRQENRVRHEACTATPLDLYLQHTGLMSGVSIYSSEAACEAAHIDHREPNDLRDWLHERVKSLYNEQKSAHAVVLCSEASFAIWRT